MPTLYISTNSERSAIPADFLAKTSKFMADLTEHDKTMVFINFGDGYLFDSTDPFILVQMHTLSGFDSSAKAKIAAELTEFLVSQLQVPSVRIYIKFVQLNPAEFAGDGKLLADVSM